MKQLKFVIIGGDLRQLYLTRMLAADGHDAAIFGAEKAMLDGVEQLFDLDCLHEADCILLPIPVAGTNGLNLPLSDRRLTLGDLLDAAEPSTLLLGGKVSPSVAAAAHARGFQLIDYLEREEFAVANAVPTAEGACALAMDELPMTLRDAKALVVGFGRCGKLLAHRLKGLGCDLTVSARKPADLAWISAYGYRAIKTGELAAEAGKYDLIFNTVPALVIDRPVLEVLCSDCLVIDLASNPGGVDFVAAAELGVKVIWALSLPGKLSPLTSGGIIRDTIYNILEERLK